MLSSRLTIPILKIIISLAALSYIGYLAGGIFADYLGPNPVEVLTHKTGLWGLHFLLLTLLITPLRRHAHWSSLIQLRRFLGLWSFAFLLLHLTVFVVFDHFFDWHSITDDILQRPYITVGMLALLLMVPLAVTSLRYFQRRLGKRWVQLHRTVYLVALLAIVHYVWLVKADILWPIIYGLLVLALLGDRVYWFWQKQQQQRSR